MVSCMCEVMWGFAASSCLSCIPTQAPKAVFTAHSLYYGDGRLEQSQPMSRPIQVHPAHPDILLRGVAAVSLRSVTDVSQRMSSADRFEKIPGSSPRLLGTRLPESCGTFWLGRVGSRRPLPVHGSNTLTIVSYGPLPLPKQK